MKNNTFTLSSQIKSLIRVIGCAVAVFTKDYAILAVAISTTEVMTMFERLLHGDSNE